MSKKQLINALEAIASKSVKDGNYSVMPAVQHLHNLFIDCKQIAEDALKNERDASKKETISFGAPLSDLISRNILEMPQLQEKYSMDILNKQEKDYGDFTEFCEALAKIRSVTTKKLPANATATARCSLEMILLKIARLINGDLYKEDTWRDIAGYATLMADKLKKDGKP